MNQPLGIALADTLSRQAVAAADCVRDAVLHLAAERAIGHTGLDLEALRESDPQRPWAAQLLSSGVVGDGSGAQPLVLRHGILRFARDARAEATIVARVRAAAAAPAQDHDGARLRPLMQKLFPAAATTCDWQALAAATVLRRDFSVIAGGPGTGKTTTVLRCLALLVARQPNLRIALAAPTGKAAARLLESIHAGLADFPPTCDSTALRAALPPSATTIHRLLGFQPQRNHFRYQADRVLPVDVVVVDEVSMADVLLMRALLVAVPASARIILIGDSDQLASVEAGYVLGDLCRAAGSDYSAASAQWATELGLAVPPAIPQTSALAEMVVHLRHTYRFANAPGIGAVAAALRSGDGAAVRAALGQTSADFTRLDHGAGPDAALGHLLPTALACTQATDPAQAVQALQQMRILAATRNGPWGVRALDAWLEQRLRAAGAPDDRGRPVLITANDAHLGLANGDLGVTWREDGVDQAVFAVADGLRRIPLQRLPAHESAWAMTIHKSQGSEYGQVAVVIPPGDGPWLTRELLYTGITRARNQVTVVGTVDQIATAAGRSAARSTGLSRELA